MSNPPSRGFPEAEFARRTERAQALMAGQGLAGLLLMSEAELAYFSGFRTLFWQSPTRPWFLFVPASGKPIAVIPEIGADLMRRSWLEDIRTWSAPRPDDDGISLLIDLLRPLAENRARIGLLKGHGTGLRMPLAEYERLIDALPGLQIQDATGLVRSLRMVKSDAEIAKIRHICGIASRSFAALPQIAQEGQPLEDLFRSFRQHVLSEGADDAPYLVGGADQGGYRDVISPPTAQPLRRGDIAMLDLGATWDGYFCDFDRTFAVGDPDDLSRRAYDVLWRATESGIEAARPGITCAELCAVMQKVIAEIDDQSGNVGRLGHGLGLQLTEWPSLAAFDQTVLCENMVLTLEPSLAYGDGRLMVHEENIVVRAEGAEVLTTRAECALPVI